MDRNSIIVIVVCFALLLLLRPLSDKLFPPKPLPPGLTNALAEAQTVTATNPIPTPVVAPPTFTPATTLPLVFATNVPEETVVVTNDNGRYTFTSRGGGLKLVELVHYPETVSRQHKNQPLTNGVATLNTRAPAPVLAMLGDEGVQGDGIFALTPTAAGVRAEKTLTNGLRLVKEFQLSTNYLVNASVWLENTSSNTLTLPAQEWVIGTATPMGPDDKNAAQNMGLMWYDGAKKQEIVQSWFDNRGFMCTAGTPRTEYLAGASNVVWAAVHNQFFALVAMPKGPALQVVSRPVDLPRPSEADLPQNQRIPAPPKGFLTSLTYAPVTLTNGQVIERQICFFAGPKEYRTLARVAERFQNNVDLVMGFGFFGFFSKALLLGMNWLHNAFKLSYGWAIIAITVIIKLLFWPLTQASTRSMKRMAVLQPQMKALQQKYKDDPARMNKKMMEFWKENKVNPMGGCLPMALQMPVFFGFFTMIRSAIELRGGSFLWVADLSKPDTLFIIPGLGFIPFIGSPEGLPFNLLPLLMGATMLWQTHLTPPSPGMDPMQQKLMRYMPLMFLAFLYNYSAGLALYWTVQNLLSIAQTKLTRTASPTTPQVSVLTPAQKKKK